MPHEGSKAEIIMWDGDVALHNLDTPHYPTQMWCRRLCGNFGAETCQTNPGHFAVGLGALAPDQSDELHARQSTLMRLPPAIMPTEECHLPLHLACLHYQLCVEDHFDIHGETPCKSRSHVSSGVVMSSPIFLDCEFDSVHVNFPFEWPTFSRAGRSVPFSNLQFSFLNSHEVSFPIQLRCSVSRVQFDQSQLSLP